jgi:hypothetical protein
MVRGRLEVDILRDLPGGYLPESALSLFYIFKYH